MGASAVAMKSTHNRLLGTLLDNMRESIQAPHCNLWCLKGGRGKPVLICILTRSLGFRAVNSRTQQFQRKPYMLFDLYPTLNTWHCLWSDSWLVK